MFDFDIIVDENSTNIAKELNNYAYLNKGSKLYIDDFNHAIDAIRYNVTLPFRQSKQRKLLCLLINQHTEK